MTLETFVDLHKNNCNPTFFSSMALWIDENYYVHFFFSRHTITTVMIWRWYVPSYVLGCTLMLCSASEKGRGQHCTVKMLGKLIYILLPSMLVYTASHFRSWCTVKRLRPPAFTSETQLTYQIMLYFSSEVACCHARLGKRVLRCWEAIFISRRQSVSCNSLRSLSLSLSSS